MAEAWVGRRLAAIVAADVVGYSRLRASTRSDEMDPQGQWQVPGSAPVACEREG